MIFFFLQSSVLASCSVTSSFTFLTEENESYFLFKKREKNIDIIEGEKNPTFFFFFGQPFLYLEIVTKHFPTLQSPLSIFPPP